MDSTELSKRIVDCLSDGYDDEESREEVETVLYNELSQLKGDSIIKAAMLRLCETIEELTEWQEERKMRIHTIEENYDYRMKRLIKKFVKDYGLENLNAEELQDKLWNEYSKEFAQAVLEDMQEFSGDELFDNETE